MQMHFFAFFCISRSHWFFAYFAFFCIFLHMFCLQFPFDVAIHSKKNWLSLRVAILSVYCVCSVNVLCAVNRIACLLSPQL